MYKQLMSEPYCMIASDIDNMTFAQFLLYFTSDEDVKGTRQISTSELKRVISQRSRSDDVVSRKEFLKRGEEIREKKKKEFDARRQKRIEAAKGSGRKKR